MLRFVLHLFLLVVHCRSIQCLGCFKCMTSTFINDTCRDPFNPIDNRYENECQATIKGKNGIFPAKFCVKITGVILDLDKHLNRSLLHQRLSLRTCITDNIMDSSRSLDSTGNFRLKNFGYILGEIRMQGTISLCSTDGCNKVRQLTSSPFIIFFTLFFVTQISVSYF